MFKNYFKVLLKYKFFIFIFLIVSFFIGYGTASYFVNENFSFYVLKCKTDVNLEEEFNYTYLKKVESEIINYNKIIKSQITYYNVNLKELDDSTKIIKENDYYIIQTKKSLFPNDYGSSSGKIIYGTSRCSKFFSIFLADKRINTFDVSFIVDGNEVNEMDLLKTNLVTSTKDILNPYLFGLYVTLFALVIIFILFYVLLKYNKINSYNDISNNETIFKTPFHKKYWKYAFDEIKNIKKLSLTAILFAMMLATKFIPIPSGFANLKISLSYLIFSVIGMLLGPVTAAIIGIPSDVLGYLIRPEGYFFPGYTLSAILSGFIYGLCFYKTKVTFIKCLYSRMFVNIFINVILGTLWYSIMYSPTIETIRTYLFLIELPKNITFLIPQVLAQFILLKAVSRVSYQFGYTEEIVKDNFSLI